MPKPWDYLIVTASNDLQARACRSQLEARRALGLLGGVADVRVVADPGGRRVGSGGSTLCCLMEVLARELAAKGGAPADAAADPAAFLRPLRILVLHAGGDSRRLPAYGPCGKLFVPVPGMSDSALGTTLFDRLLPVFLDIPEGPAGAGQVVVASGDALVRFDPAELDLARPGIVSLGCLAAPEEASRHGVFCPGPDGRVRRFLQKPSPGDQVAAGAIDRSGRSILDLGIMSLDAASAAALLRAFPVLPDPSDPTRLAWTPSVRDRMLENGLDLYREVSCAMGTEATPETHRAAAAASGSSWEPSALAALYRGLRDVPFFIQALARCHFLHFGTTRQLIDTGQELVRLDQGTLRPGRLLSLNNRLEAGGGIEGADSWIEGCRIAAPLCLAGRNVMVGVDVDRPLALPAGACLDVLAARTPQGRPAWAVRCYHVEDTFKDTVATGATFCGIPILLWLEEAGVRPEDTWEATVPADRRSLWDARVFPLVDRPDGWRDWLWMLDPARATPQQKKAFLAAERASAAQIAVLADQDAFHTRRADARAREIRLSLREVCDRAHRLSADDLAHVLARTDDRAGWVAGLLAEARWRLGDGPRTAGLETFACCRILHSLGTALPRVADSPGAALGAVVPGLAAALPADTRTWLREAGLDPAADAGASAWAETACARAFALLNEAILHSSLAVVERPRNALRGDEAVWGRAPARLELGGGWTDTPPYTLEFGGDVANTAVDLNGQPPIHCYGRVIPEPVIRLFSVDTGQHAEIAELPALLDFRDPRDVFGLVKASLAIAGFSPEASAWAKGATLRDMLREFGGGIELSTLAGIPKGSGLGTSSIVGAVIVAVVNRMMGRPLSARELFHQVLRLEQALTTGGGWQDQIGGGVGGTKVTSTRPGLFPDPAIHYVPSDLLDPRLNGGSTLLYYTGVTRLAKNILQQVVGGYFNRDRRIMAALAEEHRVAHAIADALSRKDAARFGHLVNEAWGLQKRLCGDVTNEAIETLLARIGPHIHGARILGAGSGGFMLMICRSPEDAAAVRRGLLEKPLNDRARFFDFGINPAGLEITTC
jgi:galactokinase/mevalonate kinase-like predicted kinase